MSHHDTTDHCTLGPSRRKFPGRRPLSTRNGVGLFRRKPFLKTVSSVVTFFYVFFCLQIGSAVQAFAADHSRGPHADATTFGQGVPSSQLQGLDREPRLLQPMLSSLAMPAPQERSGAGGPAMLMAARRPAAGARDSLQWQSPEPTLEDGADLDRWVIGLDSLPAGGGTTPASPLKNRVVSSPPRKRGSRDPQETWIPASAGMTIEMVSRLVQRSASLAGSFATYPGDPQSALQEMVASGTGTGGVFVTPARGGDDSGHRVCDMPTATQRPRRCRPPAAISTRLHCTRCRWRAGP